MNNSHKTGYTVKDFLPLMSIACIIVSITALKAFVTNTYTLHAIMNDFMGFFFIIFGFFKIINLRAFAEAYARYDLIAQKSRWYALAYPFIELFLGIAYIFRWNPVFINVVTLLIMLVSAVGVALELSKGKTIMCACLGTVFKIPSAPAFALASYGWRGQY